MIPGWLRRKQIGYRAKKISDETITHVDSTLRANPQLTIEEALGIINKNKSIFFPAEADERADLKTLFASIVWKTYRCRYYTNPLSASHECRSVVLRAAHGYLSRANISEGNNADDAQSPRKGKSRRLGTLAFTSVAAALVIAAVGGFFYGKGHVRLFVPAGAPEVLPSENIRYNGYMAAEGESSALIDEKIYKPGERLGPDGIYVLKNIYPRHIVIESQKDNTDLIVWLQNR